MSGYTYGARLIAPQTVEFHTIIPQGYRIVRVYTGDDIRVTAFNEISFIRTPATLFLSELENLVARATAITNASKE